ncbi:hypothetical protein AB0C04_02600 [Micromonospora sp. NPDC048909]|uniref:hypothetical protein n=1 Tax=Micromonospora sp. NPDC048909 TaxID=3155643 RepID=UPI0033D3407B
MGGVPAARTPAGGSTQVSGSGNPRPGRYDGGPDLGTVYSAGTDGPGFTTIALPSPAETSGSLTGHILAQGWSDTPAERSSTTRVVVVLAAALGLLVVISVLIVLLAGDAVDGLIGSVLSG